MSHEGKLRRGKAWWNFRDREGNLPPEIADDPGKMCEVNYFLDNQKKQDGVANTIENAEKPKKKGVK